MVKIVTNTVLTAEELGGASTHTKKSSGADGAYDSAIEILTETRQVIDLMPLKTCQNAPVRPFFDDAVGLDASSVR